MTRDRPRRLPKRLLMAAVALPAILAALFVLNGTVIASRETPRTGTTSHPAAHPPGPGDRIRIFSYNIAKAFVHRGGISFESPDAVRLRLDGIAEIVKYYSPDLVVLQEAVFECGPCPVNQVTHLALATGMHSWVFGENYNLGLPFFRIAGGNAVLCRWKLDPVSNPDLPGRKPFWVSTNNRRILWCETTIGGEAVFIGVVHADSFSLEGSARQMAHVLGGLGTRSAILAGDFNAEPHDETMRLVKESGRFSGEVDGGHPSFPAPAPRRRIDFVLAPKAWDHLGTRVISSDASDHAAVVADFRIR